MSQRQHSHSLIQQLTKHFDLETELFSEQSGFFYEGAQRQHNLETLRHLASFGDMVLFLTGDKGAGKTLMLHKLVASSFEGLNIIYLDCEQLIKTGQGRSSDILKVCSRAIGLELLDKPVGETLNTILAECHRVVAKDGVRTVFAFDNADKLPKKELQEYCTFCKKMPPESALVMLFAGSSSLVQMSKLGGDEGDWSHQIQLKPLSQSDVIPYLDEALKLSGYSESLELTDNQIQQIVDLGKGLPGRINKIFPSIVLEPGLLKIKRKPRTTGVPVWIMFGLAGLLVVSFIFVSYQHGLFDRIAPVFSLSDEPNQGGEAKVGLAKGQVSTLEQQSQQELKQRERIAMLDKVIKEKGLGLPDASATEMADEQRPVIEGGAEVDKSIGDQGAINELKELGVTERDSGIESDVGLSIAQSDSAKLVAAPEKNEVSTVQSSDAIKPNSKPDQSKQAIVDEKDSLWFRSKVWLQEKPKTSYMAQILGSYSEETALKFIEKIGKQKFEVYYLKTEHKGKAWYVVFYGVFPAKTHAQDAVKNAPKLIRSQNPWIRRASDVLSSYPK